MSRLNSKLTKSLFVLLLLQKIIYANLPDIETNLGTLTLEQAVSIALHNNTTVVNTELDRIGQKYDLALAYKEFAWNYTLSGSASYNRTITDASNTFQTRDTQINTSARIKSTIGTILNISPVASYDPDNDNYDGSLTLTLSQPLLKGFGKNVVTNSLTKAKNSEVSNQLTLRDTIETTINTIITKYRELLQAQLSLEIQIRALQNTRKNESQTRAMITAGRQAPSDIYQVQSATIQAALTMDQRENDLAKKSAEFMELLGLDGATKFNLPEDIEFTNYALPTVSESQSMALANNIDYQKQILTLENNQGDLTVSRNNLLWDLNISLSTTLRPNRQGASSAAAIAKALNDVNANSSLVSQILSGRTRTDSVRINLTIPIDNLSAKRGYEQQQVNIRKSENDLAKKQREIETQVLDSIRNIQIALEQYRLAREAYIFAERTLKADQEKANFGRITTFELVKNTDTVTSSANEVINKKISYLNAITEFEKLIGRTLHTWSVQIKY